MCGIFGLIESGPAADIVQSAIEATHALAHRGPDDWGVTAFVPWQSDGWPGPLRDPRVELRPSPRRDVVVLGHRRLSIIDVSAAGRQPMRTQGGASWLTFNGEVYNYRELRRELAARGAVFTSATDSEVLLGAYAAWGLDCLAKLRGMFAFGIWDAARERLVLARDRVGKKPLFYYRTNGRLAFASELKALMTLPGWQPRIDAESLHDYLTYGYVPGTQTILEDVRKVPPGCALVWENGEIAIEQYWDVEACFTARPVARREAEVRDEVRSLVEEAVKIRLVSDVPLGAFLSGGLDSSAVVGLMARHLGPGIKTFSIGFRESSFNELEHARTVARQFATDHHEFVVEPRAADLLDTLVWSLDEPFADASALPSFILARLAREHVTVVLTGDGGDEAFAGYDSYRAERWLAGYLRAPAALRTGFERLLRNRKEASSRTALVRRAKRFVEKSRLPFERREWRQIFPGAVKPGLYQPDFAARVGARDSLDRRAAAFRSWRSVDAMRRLQLWDLTVYLPDDLMVKTDRTAMAHGLEARCPLLDHAVLEGAARIPTDMILRGSQTKSIFKDAVADLLPPSILSRRKQGFGVPVSHWFRSELRDLSRDVLLSRTSADRGYFRADAVQRLIDLHESGREDHGHQLWALVTLELWHRRHDRRLGAPRFDLAGCVDSVR